MSADIHSLHQQTGTDCGSVSRLGRSINNLNAILDK